MEKEEKIGVLYLRLPLAQLEVLYAILQAVPSFSFQAFLILTGQANASGNPGPFLIITFLLGFFDISTVILRLRFLDHENGRFGSLVRKNVRIGHWLLVFFTLVEIAMRCAGVAVFGAAYRGWVFVFMLCFLVAQVGRGSGAY